MRDVRLKGRRQHPLTQGTGGENVPPESRPAERKPRTEPAAAIPERSRPCLLDVLVAEDNDVNQIVFSQILQQAGLRFLIVGNGKRAVQAWEEYNPALILMDVSMPVMNGHQATLAIRAAEKSAADGRHVPIIGVTAHTQEADRERCLEVGMDDYLSKPISPESLEDKIAQWLGQDRLRRDAPGI